MKLPAAQLTRISSRPNAATACLTVFWHLSQSRTSPWMPFASIPSAASFFSACKGLQFYGVRMWANLFKNFKSSAHETDLGTVQPELTANTKANACTAASH